MENVADLNEGAAQVEAIAQKTSEGEVQEDWKGKYEVSEQARQDSDALLKKKEQDWRSQKNELLIKRNTEDMVIKIAEHLQVEADTITKPVKEVMESLGDEQSKEIFADQADEVAKSLKHIASEGGILLSSDDARRVNRIWRYGQSLFDSGKVEEALREFKEAESEMVDTVERVKRRNEREAETVQREEEKRDLVESGAADLSSPRGTGSAKSMSWQAAQKINKVGDLSDEAYETLISSGKGT